VPPTPDGCRADQYGGYQARSMLPNPSISLGHTTVSRSRCHLLRMAVVRTGMVVTGFEFFLVLFRFFSSARCHLLRMAVVRTGMVVTGFEFSFFYLGFFPVLGATYSGWLLCGPVWWSPGSSFRYMRLHLSIAPDR
jgi:hypothetical protein